MHLSNLLLLFILGPYFPWDYLRNLKGKKPVINGQKKKDPIVSKRSILNTPNLSLLVLGISTSYSILDFFES
jgi:hypothetical protein